MKIGKAGRAAAATTVAVLVLSACSTSTDEGSETSTTSDAAPAAAPISFDLPTAERYNRTATYPVYLNRPEGEPLETETVAEISTVTPDGNTVIYTDATARRIGFVDITDPVNPVGTGTLSLAELGSADDQPTSVIAVGEFVLVVVDTTGGDFVNPSGRLDVVRLSDRTRVTSIDLAGQPDSIAVDAAGEFAAIAIENQRDEEATPDGGDEGDLPQQPAGFLQIVDLVGAPETWQPRRVDFDVDQAREAGLDTPEDLEPEYVTISSSGQIAVTFQENNGIAVLNRAGEVANIFSAGTASVAGIDTAEDGTIDQSGSFDDLPREPDAIGWIGDNNLAIANEGDWKGGTRGWSIIDATTGDVVWDAGNSFEQLAVRIGSHIESRSEAKGPEPEGLAITEINGTPVALVASERSNFVAVYDVSDPANPQFRQVLPSTPGPEGLLAIPQRNLLVIASEVDDAEASIRGALNLYGFGDQYLQPGSLAFPSIVSGDVDGAPIGWGALGALTADPSNGDRLYTATDNAYGPARILGVDLTQNPALIDSELAVTEDGEPVTLDTEGIAARPEGGFLLAVEGEEGSGNELVYVDADGAIEQRVGLPDDIAAAVGAQGLEGVAVDGDAVWVVLQREIEGDPAGVTRIGRYSGDTWEWFGYQLDTTDVPDAWVGVSEVTVADGQLLILERDNVNGVDARVKAIYRVAIPDTPGVSGTEAPPVLPKTLARDVLPDLQATRGYVQEKIEGLTVAGNGNLYLVTDNDGVEDASGETQFFNLGPVGAALTP